MTKCDPNLSAIFHALSDPTRRGFLEQLGAKVLPAGDLARPTGLALPTVMKHLQVLEDAGLISTEKSGRSRMCRAEPAALAATADWLAVQRAVWEARTDRLEAYVATLMKDAKP